jgi:uncharacterized DUF497 family protein
VKFEWDENKNLANIKKHKISFVQAHYAFFDPFKKEYYDDKHSAMGEERLMLAGYAENSVLLISFTEPEPETVRIISARRAKKHEEEKYYYGNG